MKTKLAKVKIPRVKIPVKVSGFLWSVKDSIHKHSPEILLVSGLSGFVGTVILACKATTKLPEMVEEHEGMIDDIHTYEEHRFGDENQEPMPKNELAKMKAEVYFDIVKDYIFLYGPSVSLGLASGACIVGSYGIEKKRYTGLLGLRLRRIVNASGRNLGTMLMSASATVGRKSSWSRRPRTRTARKRRKRKIFSSSMRGSRRSMLVCLSIIFMMVYPIRIGTAIRSSTCSF